VRGDLDWIVMKALEKDRARRYETANGLARDIERHLSEEPIVARPPSGAYRFQKLVRRNKLAFAAAALIAAVLVAATGVSARQAVRARRAEKLAAGRLIDSENARQEAEAISKFLTQVFQSSDPARDGRTITVAETLSNAVMKLETELTNQPARRAKLQATLGRTYRALGLFRDAIPLQERVRDYNLAVYGLENTNTLIAMHNLARSFDDAGRLDEALKLREQVVELMRKLMGPEHPDTLKAIGSLAISYSEVGRRDEALKLRAEALRLNRKVNGLEHPDTLVAMGNLANSYYETGRLNEALKLREEALPLSRKVNGPENPWTLTAIGNLAISYQEAGRQDEALKLRVETLAISRKVSGAEHPDTLRAMINLANSYNDLGRWEEALKLMEEALPLCRKVNGPEHPATLVAMDNLANCYYKAGHWEEARKWLEDALPLSRKLSGPGHPDTLWVMNTLVDAYAEGGRSMEATALLEKVYEADPKDTEVWLTLATWQAWLGLDAEYEVTRGRLVQQAEGTDVAGTAERAAKLACLRPSTNAALLAKALTLGQQGVELGKTNSWLPWYQLGLGFAEYRNGQYANAEQALSIAEQTAGENHDASIDVQHQLQGTARLLRAMTLFRRDNPNEARKLFTQAEAQMPPLPKDDSNPLLDGKPASHDVLIWWLAYKEAKALIEVPSPPAAESSRAR